MVRVRVRVRVNITHTQLHKVAESRKGMPPRSLGLLKKKRRLSRVVRMERNAARML